MGVFFLDCVRAELLQPSRRLGLAQAAGQIILGRLTVFGIAFRVLICTCHLYTQASVYLQHPAGIKIIFENINRGVTDLFRFAQSP